MDGQLQATVKRAIFLCLFTFQKCEFDWKTLDIRDRSMPVEYTTA